MKSAFSTGEGAVLAAQPVRKAGEGMLRRALARGYRVVLPHDAHATYDVPAAEGIGDAVPAATVSRVAEWALGDEVRVVARAADVSFEAAE